MRKKYWKSENVVSKLLIPWRFSDLDVWLECILYAATFYHFRLV